MIFSFHLVKSSNPTERAVAGTLKHSKPDRHVRIHHIWKISCDTHTRVWCLSDLFTERCRWPERGQCPALYTCPGWTHYLKICLLFFWSEETIRVFSPSTHEHIMMLQSWLLDIGQTCQTLTFIKYSVRNDQIWCFEIGIMVIFKRFSYLLCCLLLRTDVVFYQQAGDSFLLQYSGSEQCEVIEIFIWCCCVCCCCRRV